MHEKELIKHIDAVKTLDEQGYYVMPEYRFLKRTLYHLHHREFDYPLFTDDDPSFVVAKGLAYCIKHTSTQTPE